MTGILLSISVAYNKLKQIPVIKGHVVGLFSLGLSKNLLNKATIIHCAVFFYRTEVKNQIPVCAKTTDREQRVLSAVQLFH